MTDLNVSTQISCLHCVLNGKVDIYQISCLHCVLNGKVDIIYQICLHCVLNGKVDIIYKICYVKLNYIKKLVHLGGQDVKIDIVYSNNNVLLQKQSD